MDDVKDKDMDMIVSFEVGHTGGMDEKGRMILEPVIIAQFGDGKFRQLYPVQGNDGMLWRWLTIATPSEQETLDAQQKVREDNLKKDTPKENPKDNSSE